MSTRILAACTCVLLVSGAASPREPVELTLDTGTTYQTWEGWGGTAGIVGVPFEEWIADPTGETYDRCGVNADLPVKYLARLQDDLVFDVGLNRFRLEVGPQVEIENDNDDPQVTDAGRYRWLWQDHVIETHLLPLRERVEARGDRMVLYVSYDLRSSLTEPFLLEPDEYAEMAEAFVRHTREKYGLEPDYWSVINEPGNHRPGDPQLCAELTAAVGRRLARAGFGTKMSGPECVHLRQVPDYVRAMRQTPGALEHFRQLTYHLYWGGADDVEGRRAVRGWAAELGVTVAQTEWMEQQDMDVARHILLCLTEAHVVAWERYGLSGFYTAGWRAMTDPESDALEVERNSTAWHVRQFSHWIRPGAIRVRVDSSDPSVRPVAFLSPAGQAVVVVLNTGDGAAAVSLAGLPAGRCEATCTAKGAGMFGAALPATRAGSDGRLAMELPAQSVTTVAGAPELTGGRAGEQ